MILNKPVYSNICSVCKSAVTNVIRARNSVVICDEFNGRIIFILLVIP